MPENRSSRGMTVFAAGTTAGAGAAARRAAAQAGPGVVVDRSERGVMLFVGWIERARPIEIGGDEAEAREHCRELAPIEDIPITHHESSVSTATSGGTNIERLRPLSQLT